MIINCFAREVDKVVQLLFAIAYCPGRIRAESLFVWVASDSVTFFNFLHLLDDEFIEGKFRNKPFVFNVLLG